MSPAEYIPVHSGMPAPDPSSNPADLTSISNIEKYLAGTPFASRSISLLSNPMSYSYRIHLLVPFGGSEWVVLKAVQPYMRNVPELALPLGHEVFEVEAMTRVRLGLNLTPTSLVTIPEIYHLDTHNHVIIMEDYGADTISLREFMESSDSSFPALADSIGTAAGEFIASVHEWSRSNPDGVLDRFEKNDQGRAAAAQFNHNAINAIPRHQRRNVLVMGDFWIGSVFVNTKQQQPFRLYVLDWDLPRTDVPAADVGIFCGSTELYGGRNPTSPAATMVQNFNGAYARNARRDEYLARDTLAYWGSCLEYFAPRDTTYDGQVISEYIEEGKKIVSLAHSGGNANLEQSQVKALLPDLNI